MTSIVRSDRGSTNAQEPAAEDAAAAAADRQVPPPLPRRSGRAVSMLATAASWDQAPGH
ncbi:hypothetical protein [Pseudactinotalea sp.]|uniref:hypothetical protein n=1 Tax=Pseudactinotalea sp. TaxID=1926260 RepID=UPI003B3BB699